MSDFLEAVMLACEMLHVLFEIRPGLLFTLCSCKAFAADYELRFMNTMLVSVLLNIDIQVSIVD